MPELLRQAMRQKPSKWSADAVFSPYRNRGSEATCTYGKAFKLAVEAAELAIKAG